MQDERAREIYERGTDPTRVLALSDGVFAIILTLLVLEIHVPKLGAGQTLRTALREIRPSLTAFLISFVIVAIAWAGHRDVFALIRRTDRAIVWLNFLYLLPLSILPFGAAMLAAYERDPIALRIYGLILVATVVTRLAVWLYATRRTHILIAPVDARSRRGGVFLVALPGLGYLLGMLVAESAPDARDRDLRLRPGPVLRDDLDPAGLRPEGLGERGVHVGPSTSVRGPAPRARRTARRHLSRGRSRCHPRTRRGRSAGQPRRRRPARSRPSSRGSSHVRFLRSSA